MAEITREERARLRELEAKATKGPWDSYGDNVCALEPFQVFCRILESPDCKTQDANGELIAAARNALIPLLDALDAAEAETAGALGLMRAKEAETCAAIARAEKAEAERDSFRDGIVAMLVAAGAPEDIGAMESMVSAAGKKPSDFVRQRIRVLTEELDELRSDRDDALLHLPAGCGSLADAASTLKQDRDRIDHLWGVTERELATAREQRDVAYLDLAKLHRLNADIAPFDTSTVDALRAELAAMRAERDALKARLAEAGDKVQEMCERIGRIHIADYATESVELCEGLDRIRAVLLDSRDMDALKAKLADLKAREAKLRDAIAAKYPGIESSTDLEQILRAALAQGGA